MTSQTRSLDSVVREAVAFHGHLGPFLVLGIRMGLTGLRELKANEGELKQAIAILKQTPPFSCTIDGIQITTHCTVGNGKLKLKDKSDAISAIFEDKKGEQVIVTLRSKKFEELKKALPKNRQSQINIRLAKDIASTPETDLFTIKKRAKINAN